MTRKLLAAGFVQHTQRGSHVKFIRQPEDAARLVVIVPRHREVSAGALRGIVRQAGLSRREFDRL